MRRALPFAVVALLIAGPAASQATWQPAQAPLVTADNEPWFQSGTAIEWDGNFYYPAGARQFFKPNQMVRSGAFRGIPLYVDATLEPYSIVFVPVGGGQLQPYERRRAGALAGTTGSITPSMPIEISAEGVSTSPDAIAQAPAPPTYAPAYQIESDVTAEPSPVGTTGRVSLTPLAATLSTPSRLRYVPNARIETATKPQGINGAWIEFDQHRWIGSGRAVEFDAHLFREAGSYHGHPVYHLAGDNRTLYVPIVAGTVAPYKKID